MGNATEQPDSIEIDSDYLIKIFSPENLKGTEQSFFLITSFIPGKIGFSVQIDYPQDISFIAARTQDGKEDDVILIRIAAYPDLVKANSQKVPMFADISRLSRYLTNHIHYDDTDPASPTLESVELRKRAIQPRDLESTDIYLDLNEKIVVDDAGNKWQPDEFLSYLIKEHIKTTRLIAGMGLRSRIACNNFWQYSSKWLFSFLHKQLLPFILKWCTGRNIQFRSNISPGDKNTYQLSEEGFRKELFGASASPFAIFWSAFLGLILVTIAFSQLKQQHWLRDVLSSGIGAFSLGVLAILFFDSILPTLLLWLSNYFKFLDARLPYHLRIRNFFLKE